MNAPKKLLIADAVEHSQPVLPAGDPTALVYSFADALSSKGIADELIEGLLVRGGSSADYGESNSGKTFLAVDMAWHVALASTRAGVKWMGRNVQGGLVIYLACESPASITLRLLAKAKVEGCMVANFVVVQSPVDLFNGAADTERVIDLVKALEVQTGRKCELIIGDTLSRLAAGANENSSDMAVVVRHIDRIRADTGAHFALVAHSGKDALKGMRGWSGMRAAIDTEIEIVSDEATGIRCAETTKQRDLPGKGERIGFRLQSVDLGLVSKWGKPVTSCVVIADHAPAKPGKATRTSEGAGAVLEFLRTRGTGIKKKELVKHFNGVYDHSVIYREVKKMATAGLVVDAAGVVGLVQL